MAHDKQVPAHDDDDANSTNSGPDPRTKERDQFGLLTGDTVVSDPRDPPYQHRVDGFDPGSPTMTSDLEQYRRALNFLFGGNVDVTINALAILIALTPGTVALRMQCDLIATQVRSTLAGAVRDIGSAAGWHWVGAAFDDRGRLRVSVVLRTTPMELTADREDGGEVLVSALLAAYQQVIANAQEGL